MRRWGIPLTSLAWLAAPAFAAAQATSGGPNGNAAPRRAIAGVRVAASPPSIDGRLDDVAWQSAALAGEFVQQRPQPGAPSTSGFETEARVLYDDHAIYVAIRAHDPAPDSLAATLGRRDFTGFSDWVQVIIDSYHDRRTAFRFAVNPAGVKKDVFHSEDFNEDIGWDAVWDAHTAIDSAGWTAEFRIPLSQLRYSGQNGEQIWGINFQRDVARRNERTWWQPILPDVPGFVSRFGELTGLVGLPSVRRLEVLPYTVTRLTRAPGDSADPFYSASDWYGSAGADIRAGLTSNLTLNATINPDFGQVEADPSVVNLTAFETFFPERRPFFIEGANIFGFNIRYPYFIRGTGFGRDGPFYSRRVGRQPQAGFPGDATYTETDAATHIVGAVKISGKTAGGWSIGLLDALTARESQSYLDTAGETRTAQLEPLSNYSVARLSRDFRQGQSAVGAIFTSTQRDINDTGLSFLRSSAYASGMDFRHRTRNGNAELSGSVLGTHIRGEPAAIRRVQLGAGHYFQRPDADHVDYDSNRTSLTGYAASLRYEKFGGGRWRYGLYGHARSPGFEMNDLGFQRSTDWLLQGAWLGYHVNRPARFYREWNVNFNNWAGTTFDGERQALGFNSNGFLMFRNFMGVHFGIDHELPAWSVSDLRGGPMIRKPTWTSFGSGFFTDGRKRVQFEFFHGGTREYQSGSWTYDFYPSVAVRPSSRMDLALAPGVSWNNDRRQFVAIRDGTDGRHYVFARIRQTTASMTLRLNYTFTNNLSLQAYAQPFISAGRYDEFKEVADPRAERFDSRFARFAPGEIAYVDSLATYFVDRDGNTVNEYSFGRPDFNVTELSSNLVLRWEYRPGSTVFVVWSSGRGDFSPDGRFDLRRDARRVFDAPGTNVFLVKFSYWMNL